MEGSRATEVTAVADFDGKVNIHRSPDDEKYELKLRG
jgi:hypothetical protein